MNQLLQKKVKIVLNFANGANGGIVGTTCIITGFVDGFVIVNDFNKQVSYYAISCIKSITVLGDEGLC